MEIKNEAGILYSLKAIFKTVVTAFLITIILMGVLALLICYTAIPEEVVTPGVYVLNYFSVFMAGLFSAAKAKKKGFVTGGVSGALYMLLVYFLGYVLFGGIEFTKNILTGIIYCLVVGMIGGIIGINLNKT